MKNKRPTRAQINAAKASAQAEYDRFMALSDAEKTRDAAAAAKMRSRPLTPAQRAMFDEMGMGSRGRGRPKKGKGARQISVTMESDLLSRVDRFARTQGMSRAQLIAKGVEILISKRAV
jgi:membrane protein involved in colicin uptake